jgi:hypothetical protein
LQAHLKILNGHNYENQRWKISANYSATHITEQGINSGSNYKIWRTNKPHLPAAARNWNRSSHDGAMHLLKVDMDGAFYLDWSERTAAITKQLSPLQEMVPYHATYGT